MILQSLLITNIYIFILAIVLAILEIQIEGEHGWAKNLPTWRPADHHWYTKLYAKVMSGRELTGYHLTMFTFVLLILNLPYVFGLAISLENILKTICLFLIFVVLWDFLWFVLNPFYPLKHFKKEHIWWHKRWMFGLPQDYYGGLLVSFLVALVGSWFLGLNGLTSWWILNFSLFLAETILVILFAQFILKIDNWQR